MKYFIVGNGDYALMLNRYLKNTEGKEIEGFTVPGEIIDKDSFAGKAVIAGERMKECYPPEEYSLIMGIGYRSMNRIKEQEFNRYKSWGYEFINYIHPTAIIEKDVEIGEGNNVFEGVILQSGVKIGHGNLIYGGALVAHDSILGNFNSLSVKACVAGGTCIGNNCFIGANATVRDHLNLADFTLLGAGAYLSRDSDSYEVIAAPKAEMLKGKSSLEFI